MNESFQLKYWRSPVDLADPPDGNVLDYVERIDRVIPSLTSGPWTVAVQVDQVALFMNRYYLDDELVIERDLVADGTPNLFPQRSTPTSPPRRSGSRSTARRARSSSATPTPRSAAGSRST